MRMYDIIEKKKHGLALTRDEIFDLIEEYTAGNIPDYQMSAFLMAVYFRSMTDEEIFDLTEAMATSGDIINLSEFGDRSVDKHSTGGVGDKTTLIVAPIVAAAGGIVAGRMAVLAEGDAQERTDIVYLEKLPLFHPDGSVMA